MEDAILKARELGVVIQKTNEYKILEAAIKANEADTKLQEQIGEFNLKRIALNEAVQAENKDEAKVADLDKQLREVYNKVMQNKNMAAYNDAKAGMDAIMNNINSILIMSVNGEDPMTCELQTGCEGSCSSCSGCH